MTVYTYDADDLAGMIARLDDAHERGNVLIVGATHAEATELLEQTAEKLGTRVTQQRRARGSARLTLQHGVDVLACIPQTTRGRTARLVAVIAGPADTSLRYLRTTVESTNGTLIRVTTPHTVQAPLPAPTDTPTPEDTEPTEAAENPDPAH